MMIEDGISGPIYREETEGDQSDPPFKFKYLFSKEPCEKCLVKAACTTVCILESDYWGEQRSVKNWKSKFKGIFQKIIIVSSIIFVFGFAMIAILQGCKSVNKQRAVEYYDQHVKHFPEEG
jgi:hypothetical protein